MSKVLIIKDNNDPSSQFLPSVFDRLGYETICLETVGDAGRYITDVDIRAVFVDIDSVTDDSALEALIQEAKPYKMVVLYGSEKKKDLICRAFELNIDDFIRKPLDQNIFEAKVKCIFERFNQLRHFHSTNLEVFLDTMPAMMVITDDMGRILFANATFCNKYNIEKEDAFNRMFCDLLSCQNFHEDGGRCAQNCEFCKLYELVNEVFSSGKKVIKKIFSYAQIQRDGRPHKRSLRISMVPMDYGTRRTVIVNIEDVTFEQNAIQELTSTICDLRESRDNSEEEMKVNRDLANYLQKINNSLQLQKTKRQLLFDNMTSGFLLAEYKDGNLYFREGNAKLSEIVRTDTTKRYGNRMRENNPLYPADFYKALLNVAETGRSVSFKTTSPDKEIDFQVNMYMPEPDFVAAIINDITEETRILQENKDRARQLKKLNVMLDDRNSELQKAIDTKNKFISIIAHDLRNPLNAINGLSELLTRRLNPEVDQRSVDMAKVLHQSAKGAYELLDDLLVWARTQQNTIQFNPETLNVHATAAETLNEIKVQAERKHIMLINNTESGDTVWADKLMLQTIIRNIVSNAIKFTNEGGLIVLASNQTADNTEISIEDNGVGMTQETIKKILGTIELNSTKGTSGETGTGMGLIISKEFIQRHKGTLNIESTLGKGSSFIITLPREPQKNDEKN